MHFSGFARCNMVALFFKSKFNCESFIFLFKYENISIEMKQNCKIFNQTRNKLSEKNSLY